MKTNMRRIMLLCIDLVLINLAVFITLSIRFAGQIPPDAMATYLVSAPVFTGVTLICLLAFKVYHRLWEYASVDEAVAIVKLFR